MTYVEWVLWVVGLSEGWAFEVAVELESYEVVRVRYAWEVIERVWWIGIMKIAAMSSPEILNRSIIPKRHALTLKTASIKHRAMEVPTTRQRYSWRPLCTLKREILQRIRNAKT